MSQNLAYLFPALSVWNFIVRKPLKLTSLAGTLREAQDEYLRLGISPGERICGYPPSLICAQRPRLIERESAGMTDRARNAAMRRKRASQDSTVAFCESKQPRRYRTLQIGGHSHLRLLPAIKLGLLLLAQPPHVHFAGCSVERTGHKPALPRPIEADG